MTPNTGDTALTRTCKPSAFNKLTDFSTHTDAIPKPPHHVQVIKDPSTHFSFQIPHATTIPHLQMVVNAVAGVRVFSVYRWHEWVGLPDDDPRYAAYRNRILGAMYFAELIEPKYDWTAAMVLAWNSIRKVSDWVPKVNAKFFCSEGAVGLEMAGLVDMMASINRQAQYAPVHFAQLVQSGLLVLVEDHGLHEFLIGEG